MVRESPKTVRTRNSRSTLSTRTSLGTRTHLLWTRLHATRLPARLLKALMTWSPVRSTGRRALHRIFGPHAMRSGQSPCGKEEGNKHLAGHGGGTHIDELFKLTFGCIVLKWRQVQAVPESWLEKLLCELAVNEGC